MMHKQGKKLHTVGSEKVPSLVWAEGPRAAISGLEPCLCCELRDGLFSLRTSRMKRAGFGIHIVKTEQKLLYGRKQRGPKERHGSHLTPPRGVSEDLSQGLAAHREVGSHLIPPEEPLGLLFREATSQGALPPRPGRGNCLLQEIEPPQRLPIPLLLGFY